MARKSYAQKFAASGGRARAQKLSPERRREIAKEAAYARWGYVRKSKLKEL